MYAARALIGLLVLAGWHQCASAQQLDAASIQKKLLEAHEGKGLGIKSLPLSETLTKDALFAALVEESDKTKVSLSSKEKLVATLKQRGAIPGLDAFTRPTGMSDAEFRIKYERWQSSLVPDEIVRQDVRVEGLMGSGGSKTRESVAKAVAVYKWLRDTQDMVNPGTPGIREGGLEGRLPVSVGRVRPAYEYGAPSIDDLWQGRLPDQFNPAGFLEVVGIVNKTLGKTCTGTFVASNLVLTAAHCAKPGNHLKLVLHQEDSEQLARCAQAMQRKEYLRCTGLKLVDVPDADVFRHPDYADGGSDRDIALWKLPPEVESKRFAKVNVSTAFTQVTLAGYGRTGLVEPTTESTGQKLFRIEVGWYNGSTIASGTLVSWHVMAKGSATGACEGDSGGPIYAGRRTGFEGNDVAPEIIGIVQGGIASCNDYETYQTSMNSSAIREWICDALTSRGAAACVTSASRLAFSRAGRQPLVVEK